MIRIINHGDLVRPPKPALINLAWLGGIALPSARSLADNSLTTQITQHDDGKRASITWQALPWATVGLRRDKDDFHPNDGSPQRGGGLDTQIRLATEQTIQPALAIGIRSAAGSGRYASEYLVSSKKIGPVDLSLGVGTGRLAGPLAVDHPLKFLGGRFGDDGVRNDQDVGPDHWGGGDKIGFFGGIRLDLPTPTPVQAIFETGGDRGARERTLNPGRKQPKNYALGLDWHPSDHWQIGVAWDGGDKVMARLSTRLDSLWSQPATPVSPRPLQPLLAAPTAHSADRLEIFGLDNPPDFATLPINSQRDHDIIITQAGVPINGLVLPGRKPDALVSPEERWQQTTQQPRNQPIDIAPPTWDQRLKLGIAPVVDLDVFEASSTAIYRQSLMLSAQAMLDTGQIGGIAARINGNNNLDKLAADRAATDFPVRSDLARYADHRLWPDRLYIGQFSHPITNFYGLLYGGFLEETRAGFGGDLLYAPFDRRWDLQLSIAETHKRSPDDAFKILAQPGAASWEISGGYGFADQQTRLVVGAERFLAGDIGLKANLSRQWPSGMIAESWLGWSNANQLPQLAEYGGADFGLSLRWPLHISDRPMVKIEPRLNIRPLGRDGVQSVDKPLILRDLVKPAFITAP